MKIAYLSPFDFLNMLNIIHVSLMNWPITGIREGRLIRNTRYITPIFHSFYSTKGYLYPFNSETWQRYLHRCRECCLIVDLKAVKNANNTQYKMISIIAHQFLVIFTLIEIFYIMNELDKSTRAEWKLMNKYFRALNIKFLAN